jgi:hypothetical protein
MPVRPEARLAVVALALAAAGSWAGGCGRGVVSVVSDESSGGGGGAAGNGGGGDGGSVGPGGAGGASGAGGGGTGGATRTCDLTADVAGVGSVVDGGASDGRACPCSRRPGENNSFRCPRGTGKVATAAIGPEGGTLSLGGTDATLGVAFSLEIPPNDLAETVVLSVTESTLPPPAAYVDWSPIYDLQPAGLTLSIPAKLTVPMTNVDGVIPLDTSINLSADCGQSYSRLPDSYEGVTSLWKLGPVFVGYPRTSVDVAACPAADAGAP